MERLPSNFKQLNPRTVAITFYDHSRTLRGGVNPPMVCELKGDLIGECGIAYYLATWISDGQVDDNTDSYTILKSTVIKLRYLKRVR